MKNPILLIFISFGFFHCYSQKGEEIMKNKADSLRKYNNKYTLSSLFFNSSSDDLIYAGVTTSYEISSLFIGGEFKLYASFYDPLFSGSIYTNYKQSVSNEGQKKINAISLGTHFTVIGVEGTVYFNKEKTVYYITPKVGFDYGSWSAFYGYGFSISKSDFEEVKGHNLSIKYSLYLSAFKYHKMRRKGMGY